MTARVLTPTIGDTFGVRVRATLDPDPATDLVPDLTGHTWECVIRSRRGAETVLATFDLINDDTTVDGTIDLLFELADTDQFTHGQRTVLGVRTTAGTYSTWTLVPAIQVVWQLGVAHD